MLCCEATARLPDCYWNMDCGLANVRTLRNVCKFLCFGGIFIWIVVGSFNKLNQNNPDFHSSDGGPHIVIGSSRRLLERDDPEYARHSAAATSNATIITIDENAEVGVKCYMYS